MELLEMNWFRLVLDGPPPGVIVTLLALPFVGVPILVVTFVACGLDAITVRKGVALIAGFLVVWLATLLIVANVG